MAYQFDDKTERAFGELLTHYPNKAAALLPVLYLAQAPEGWLSQEMLEYIGKRLELPMTRIWEVVTFYTMFYTKPVAKYHLQPCTNLSCALMGADALTEHLCRRLRVDENGWTDDRKFKVTPVECLGSCGTAPMIQVNDDYHENLDVKKLDDLIDKLARSE